MRKHFLSCVLILLSLSGLAQFTICAGSSVVITPTSTLTNPTYVLYTGTGTVSPSSAGVFTVFPVQTTVYTITATGSSTTQSYQVNVKVNAQPSLAPTTTNLACNTTTNAFNLNLTFLPVSPAPQYTITWGEPANTPGVPNPPNGWQNNQTSMSGSISPSTYTAIITTADGCEDTAAFTLTPPKAPAEFSLSPAGPYLITCLIHSVEVSASNSALTYTFEHTSVGLVQSSSIIATQTTTGNWTVTATNTISGCEKQMTFAVVVNTTAPQSNVSPTSQQLDCGTPPITVSLTAVSPTVNFTQFVYSENTATFVSNAVVALFPPAVGVNTYVLLDNVNGCVTTKQFTITSSLNFPTFGVNSAPGGFTLGCASKSVTTISFKDAQTNPNPGGQISYLILDPASTSSVTPPGPLTGSQVYTFNVPGTYTAILQDNSNDCQNRQVFTITMNTVAPILDTLLIPRQILDCANPQTVLRGVARQSNVVYSWIFPTFPGNGTLDNSSTFTVDINDDLSPSTTPFATYTLSMLETNNQCKSSTVVPMYQNLYPPRAIISKGTNSLTCATTTILLSNGSISQVPTGGIFTTGQPVEATLWEGPSPQQDLPNSSTYVAFQAGEFTMTVVDANNGCSTTTVTQVFDLREIPLIENANPSATVDCGTESTMIAPIITTATNNLSYTWTAPAQLTTGVTNEKELQVFSAGVYSVLIKNNINQCFASYSLEVVTGTLTPGISARTEEGYAPLSVTFENNSSSATGNSAISTIWSFGNDSVLITQSASITPVMVYNQPGNYTVTAYVQKGDCIDTAYSYIHVDIPSQLIVPNIFTPNGDGVNDLFFLQRAANLSEINATIYDRWGNIVYQLTSTTGNIEWDGMTQFGKEATEGTYFYIITATGEDGATYDEKGSVTLAR